MNTTKKHNSPAKTFEQTGKAGDRPTGGPRLSPSVPIPFFHIEIQDPGSTASVYSDSVSASVYSEFAESVAESVLSVSTSSGNPLAKISSISSTLTLNAHLPDSSATYTCSPSTIP